VVPEPVVAHNVPMYCTAPLGNLSIIHWHSCPCIPCSEFRDRCLTGVKKHYISAYTDLVDDPHVLLAFANDVPVISTPVLNFDTLIEEAILQEDSELAQIGLLTFPDKAPNSFT
jgi:hypothetical protein